MSSMMRRTIENGLIQRPNAPTSGTRPPDRPAKASPSDFSLSCIRAIDPFLLSLGLCELVVTASGGKTPSLHDEAADSESTPLDDRNPNSTIARAAPIAKRSAACADPSYDGRQNQPPIVRRPAIVVVLVSPVRSTSSAGPNPRKKCSAGKNMSGANRLIARFDAVTLASTPEGRSSSSKSVLVLVNEKPTRGHTDKKGEKAML